MIYKAIKVVVVLMLLFYCIKVVAFRVSATRQDAVALLVVFAVGFTISLSEAIKLRNKRKRELEAARRGLAAEIAPPPSKPSP